MDTPRYIPPADSIKPAPVTSNAPKPLLRDDKKIPPRHREVSEEKKIQREHARNQGLAVTSKMWKAMSDRLHGELNYRQYLPIEVSSFRQTQW